MARRSFIGIAFAAVMACGDSEDDPAAGESGDDSGGAAPTSSTTAHLPASSTGSQASTGGGDPDGSGDGSGDESGPDGPLDGGLVVDVAWLQRNLGHPQLQLIDARPSFASGHIPGAIAIDPLSIATAVDGVAAQIMPPEMAEPVLAAAGLRDDATLVVYGAPPEYDPARVVWALHYYGLQDVRYLDGGFAAWTAAGGEVADGAPPAEPTDFTIDAVRDEARVTGTWVLEQLGPAPYDAPAIGLVDARSDAEWASGRIPSALHVQWQRTLDDDGRLLPVDELEALYETLPEGTVVSYCLVGWRASVAWLTLRWIGREDVRVYDGSWTEWAADPRTYPVEVD